MLRRMFATDLVRPCRFASAVLVSVRCGRSGRRDTENSDVFGVSDDTFIQESDSTLHRYFIDSMASEGERCGSFGSFLALSCRGRAEDFARKLHSKLRSLGSQEDEVAAGETSWLGAHEAPIAISQPAQTNSNCTDPFLDLDLLNCPGSPSEEVFEDVELYKLMNKDMLQQLEAQEIEENSTENDAKSSRISDGDRVNGVETSEDDSDNFLSLSESTSQIETLSPKDLDSSSMEVHISTKCDSAAVEAIVNVENEANGVSGKSYEVENSNLLEANDDMDLEVPRVRRSTSLKTGKTPPGTPGSKKIVRFADALGLDLADVRTFLDDVPKIPNSAFDDLIDADLGESSPGASVGKLKTGKYLLPLFQQPGGMPNFLDIVREFNVCLENVFVDDPFLLSLKGTVRVRNLDFHKSVHIRYSLDSWKTFADLQATYVENSCDGFSDKFAFLLYAHTMVVGQRLELACRFQCRGSQYWDNNRGINYCFQCLPTSETSVASETERNVDDWEGASFY